MRATPPTCPKGLLVGDHLAEFGDALLDAGDSLGPGALAGVVGVGYAGGVFALGFSEVLEGVVEALLEGWTGHGGILACVYGGSRFARMPHIWL